MSVHWIRAIHRVLEREVVMPADAVQHAPGWEAVGEPSTDEAGLRAELAAEQHARAAEAAAAPAPTPAPPTPALPPADSENHAELPELAAPTGDDPKE